MITPAFVAIREKGKKLVSAGKTATKDDGGCNCTRKLRANFDSIKHPVFNKNEAVRFSPSRVSFWPRRR